MKPRSALMSVAVLGVFTLAWPVGAQAGAAWAPGKGRATISRVVTPGTPSTTRTPITPNGSWPVYHRDDGHTGFDPTQHTVTGVTPGWSTPSLDQQIYASPLVYGGIVYVATLNNTVYALNQTDGSVVWSTHLRAPTSSGWACGNVSPQGILGTPAIDPGTNRIYVATFGSDHVYRLEGLNLATGVPDTPTVITTPAGVGFVWQIEQERGALAVHNGMVYVPFGGRAGDCGVYHGYVFAVPESGAAVTHFYVTPGSGNGFWAGGGVVVDDSTGNVFVTSGNGNVSNGCNFASGNNPQYENDAVVSLAPITLVHQGFFMPQDWHANWCANDQDLGGAAPLLISPNLLFQAGKWGTGFLLNPTSLGGIDGQLFPAASPGDNADVCFGNHNDATFAAFAYAAPFVYVECEGQGLVALRVNTGAPSFGICDFTCASPPDWSAGAGTYGPPIVAGGAVWAASDGPGLSAFNASNGTLIYQSPGFGINRFVTLAEAGGQVFVPSHNTVLQFVMHFGVVQEPGVPPPPARPTPDTQSGAPAPPSRQPVSQSTNAPPPGR